MKHSNVLVLLSFYLVVLGMLWYISQPAYGHTPTEPAFKRHKHPVERVLDKFDMKKRPKTIPSNLPIIMICTQGVMYYISGGGGIAPVLDLKGGIILCGEGKA